MEFSEYDNCIRFADMHTDYATELEEYAYALINKAKIPELSKKCIERAAKDNILDSRKEFTNKLTTQCFYAIKYIRENFTNNSDFLSFVDDFEKLNLNQYKSFKENVDYHHFYLLTIVKNRIGKVDIIKEIIKPEYDVSNVLVQILIFTLPYLTSSLEEKAEALLKLSNGMKPEQGNSHLYDCISNISSKNLGFHDILLKKTAGSNNKEALLVPFAVVGLAKATNIQQTFPIIKALLENEDIHKILLGLNCLRLLPTVDDDLSRITYELLPLLERITESKKNNDIIIPNLLGAYYTINKFSPIALTKILKIVSNNANEVSLATLSRIMFFCSCDDNTNVKWLNEALNQFTIIDSGHLNVFGNIELVLKYLYKKDADVVFNYLNKFITYANNIRDLEGFKDVFIEMSRDKLDLLQKWITIWLNNDDPKFHASTQIICSWLWVNDIKELKLDAEILNSLSEYDIEFILIKIAGYIHSKETLESLVYSLLELNILSDYIRDTVVDLFCTHITYNYYGSTNYLKNKRITANELQKGVIDIILEQTDENYGAGKEKPKELRPSEDRLHIFRKELIDRFTVQNNSRFREPSFMDAVTKISVKFGGGMFSRNDLYGIQNRYNLKSEMSYISHSFEMPVGEAIDPVGQKYKEYHFRAFKRRGQ